MRAFHEGFADIVAVFQRLSFRDLVQRALQDGQGDIRKSRPLSDIAAQFGQGLGSGKALRTALESETKIQDVKEEHALGAVLVAAIFEGFYSTFERRTADLIRIATGGTGVLPQGALHPDLVTRLSGECVRIAQSVLTMCIRAFDYLPPADVTFGAFLRALVTADWELNPLDEFGVRAALIEACRRRGIFAAEAGSLAVNALLLDVASDSEWSKHKDIFRQWVDLGIQRDIEEQRSATPEDVVEDPFVDTSVVNIGLKQAPPVRSDVDETEDELPIAQPLSSKITAWFYSLADDQREKLGFLRCRKLEATALSLEPASHLGRDAPIWAGCATRAEANRQRVRSRPRVSDWADPGHRRYRAGAFRDRTRRVYGAQAELENTARLAITSPMGWPIDDPNADPFAVDYRGMHEARI